MDHVAVAYDAVADLYAEMFRDEPISRPLDRATFQAYAEMVGTGGRVLDAGCGPGVATAYLRSLGLDASGVDISLRMLKLARRAYPGMVFAEGSITDLPAADGEFDGVLARYSLIHLEPQRLPRAVAEFARVLRGGGHLMLQFYAGDGAEPVAFDHKVATAWRWPVDRIAGLLRENGLTDIVRMIREPGENERFEQATVLAAKPGKAQ